MLSTVAALALSTLVSEDVACVAAGALIARGDLSPAAGVLACAVGIFAGDCALWACGRFGAGVLSRVGLLGRVVRRLPAADPAVSRRATRAASLARDAGVLLVASRFTPGARLPLYVSAGVARMSFRRFGLWTGVAVAVWTPAVVLASARAGEAATDAGGNILWLVMGAGAAVVALTRAARLLAARPGRVSFRNGLRRLGRWEFWPPWLFYAPVAAWVAWLAVRHRGVTITASNPGIPDGGVVGESKAEILARLPADYTIPSHRVACGDGHDPLAAALAHMSAAGWTFPLVLKPDVGQRGVGVRLVRSPHQLASYLSAADGDVLMQPFHAGPYEAGIFYYRFPGEARGRILSITDKRFPVITGDGFSTVRRLIETDPRYSLQSGLFFARHASVLDTVLARGERLPLTIAGNHAQGTTFLDGCHLWTPALEARIDAIAQHYDGFFIGRFDVRYRHPEAFAAGDDIAIVELNGATAESTNIYDPGRSLLDAYRVLFRQWALVFAIGAANRARGIRPAPTRRLIGLLARHLVTSPAHAIAD